MNCRRCDYEIDPEERGWLSPEDVNKLKAKIAILNLGLQQIRDTPLMKSPAWMFAKHILEKADEIK